MSVRGRRLLWGMPFFLVAGHVRAVLALELVMLLPTVLLYFGQWRDNAPAVTYAVVMIALWAVWVAALFLKGRTAARARRKRPGGGLLPALGGPDEQAPELVRS